LLKEIRQIMVLSGHTKYIVSSSSTISPNE
jgi:hypothetical protein